MARHNRDGAGEDQLGRKYRISYQPDWFHQVKVTRDLSSGRQSTKTLFRNPDVPAVDPGARTRTRISSDELGVEFEFAIEDPNGVVRRITIETVVPTGSEEDEHIAFIVSRSRPRRG